MEFSYLLNDIERRLKRSLTEGITIESRTAMDESLEDDFKFDNYLEKCRCCWRMLTKDQKFLEISKPIEERFFELTQLELIQSPDLSKFICDFCDNDLNVFSNFRSSLIEKQSKLYKFLNDVLDPELIESSKILVKTEIDETPENIFIDCTSFGPNSSSFVKVELAVHPEEVDTKILRRKKKAIVSNEEHKKLLDEFKEILKHKKEKHIECPRCFKFLHRDSIKEHINVVHFELKKFECDHCDYKASRYSRVMMHLKAVHKRDIDPKYDTTKPKRQCNFCGSMIRNWRRHIMKVHMNIKNVFCDNCSYSAFFKYDLEQHMKTHVKKQVKETQKYFCESCGLSFDKRFHLNAHVKAKHTVKERIYQCKVCEKSFFSSENLKKHVESHSEKSLPCEFCGKLFSCLNNLRTHLYYHSDPKFICDFPNCDKKFYQRKRLRAHVKTHKGQKDFICSLCDKSYFSQNDLNRHTFAIHEKLRFFCQVPGCHGNFSRREYYKKHAVAHHQNLGQVGLDNLLQMIKDAQPSQKF